MAAECKEGTAVLIVTYNRLKLLRQCVDAVLGQTRAASSVYIVDNNSTDGTAGYLKELALKQPNLHVISPGCNLGGAGGFSLGVEKALCHNDWSSLLFIDDDAILAEDYLERMYLAAERESACRLFAGVVTSGGVIDTNHRRNIKNRLIFSEEWIPEERYKDNFYCQLATFCGFMADREIVEASGAPRGDYYIWYDDTEYCLHCEREAKKRGYVPQILVVTDAIIDHKSKPVEPGGNILLRTDWRSYYGWRNRYDVARTYLGAATAFTIKAEYYILGLISCFMKLSPDKAKREKASFNVRMTGDVLSDIKKGRFGTRDDYKRP